MIDVAEAFAVTREPTRHEIRKARRSSMVLIVAVAVCLIAAAAIIGYLVAKPSTWDPLGEYPIQNVESRIDGQTGPAIKVGDVLLVSGVKCSTIPVQVRGTIGWISVDPPGTNIALPSGLTRRPEGCTAFAYKNVIPPEVVDRVHQLATNGIFESTWRITGSDTPIDAHGLEGSIRVWTTTNFKIVGTP